MDGGLKGMQAREETEQMRAEAAKAAEPKPVKKAAKKAVKKAAKKES